MTSRPCIVLYALSFASLDLGVARLIVWFVIFLTVSGSADSPAYAVFRTVDRGRTWSRSDRGLPPGSRINAFGSADNHVFAGTDSGIFVSDDEGRSWRAARGPAGSKRALAFAALEGKVYAGSAKDGLLLSADRGLFWNTAPNFPPRAVRSLLVQEGRIYAGTDADGVLVSAGDGGSWTGMTAGLPPLAQIFAISALRGRVFAGLYAKGLYAWSDSSQRWTQAGRVTPLVLAQADGALIGGHNPGGLHYSDASGETWSRAASSPDLTGDAPVWQLAAGNGIAFAGASAGIYYSEDRGRNWTRARQGLPAESPGVAFHIGRGFALAGAVIKP